MQTSDKLSVGALVIASLALVLQLPEAYSSTREKFFPPASCDAPSDLEPVRGVHATSSSQLDLENTSYPASQAVDGDLLTAWVPARRGGGSGETLTLLFDEPTDVELVCIVNGYAKSPHVYEINGRLHDVSVSTDNGSATGALRNETTENRSHFQPLPAKPGTTTTISITITSIYAGSSGGTEDAHDPAVSEVQVYAAT